MAINTQKLRERIDAAIKRITSGSAPMRIPADQTDPDLVLADAKIALDAQAAEIARLRKALKDLMVASPSQLACEAFHHNPSDRHADADVCQPVKRYQDALEAARAALQEKSKC